MYDRVPVNEHTGTYSPSKTTGYAFLTPDGRLAQGSAPPPGVCFDPRFRIPFDVIVLAAEEYQPDLLPEDHMAMIILGKTKCLLCGRAMEKGEPVAGFPAFLPPDHRLSMFTDRVFHRACLEADPRAREALDLRNRFESVLRRVPRRLSRIDGEAWLSSAVEKLWEEAGFNVGAPLSPVVIFNCASRDNETQATHAIRFKSEGVLLGLLLAQASSSELVETPFAASCDIATASQTLIFAQWWKVPDDLDR